jgi:hypothetical protein
MVRFVFQKDHSVCYVGNQVGRGMAKEREPVVHFLIQ